MCRLSSLQGDSAPMSIKKYILAASALKSLDSRVKCGWHAMQPCCYKKIPQNPAIVPPLCISPPCTFSSSSCICIFVSCISPPSLPRYQSPQADKNSSYSQRISYLCHIMTYFIAFLKFCPSNSRRKCSDRVPMWHSLVDNGCHMYIYHYPTNKPPPLFCPISACTKGGGVIAGFYGTTLVY